MLSSLKGFLEGVLRLRVNRDKSEVTYIKDRKFLGYRLTLGGRLGIAPKNQDRATDRVPQITRRNRGVSAGRVVSELNSLHTGRVTYFRHAVCETRLTERNRWIRSKLHRVRLESCRRTKALSDFCQRRGIPRGNAWAAASSGKGRWRLAGSPVAHKAMDQRWFDSLGLVDLVQRYAASNS